VKGRGVEWREDRGAPRSRNLGYAHDFLQCYVPRDWIVSEMTCLVSRGT